MLPFVQERKGNKIVETYKCNAYLLIFANINIGKVNQKLMELVTY